MIAAEVSPRRSGWWGGDLAVGNGTWQTEGVSEFKRQAVVRGFASSTLAIFTALAGHVSGGGQMPGPLGLVVPWVLSLMVCVLLAGKRLSLFRLTLSVGVSQFLFHLLFVLGTITPTGARVPAHVHGAPLVLPAGGGAAEAAAADGSMWAGHLVAALVTVVALHWGERLVHAARHLADLAVRWLRQRATVDGIRPPLDAPAGLRGDFLAAARPAASPLLATLRGRAPPVHLAI